MRAVISMASLIACAVSSIAQIIGTLHRVPTGHDEIRVRNDSGTSLVAFVIAVKQTPRSGANSNTPFILFSDPIVKPGEKPLAAGEERRLILPQIAPRRDSLFQEPVVVAGIFEDGTTTGNPAMLSRLLLRRSNTLLAVETSIETLSDAGRRNVPRGQLIVQFKKMADSLRRWYVPAEQQVAILVYQPIVGKLINLPEPQLGSAFPPADFVAQEVAALNQHRVKLLESQPSLADGLLLSSP